MKKKNLINDKRGYETRLNGENSTVFALYSSISPTKGSDIRYPCVGLNLLFLMDSSSGNTNDSTQDDPVSIGMAPRQLPGVYMILCLVNNKRYYGESKNVSARISQHKSRLRRNIHEISELQNDFNLYKEDNFEFSAIYLSKEYTLNQRVELEIKLIGRFKDLCYNKFDKTSRKKENNPFWRRTHSDETRKQIGKSQAEKRNNLEGLPILLNGNYYPSISEASRQTSHSRDTIRRWLNDSNNVNCVTAAFAAATAADTSKPCYVKSTEDFLLQDSLVANTGLAKRVSIYGVTYPSIAEAARQKGCSRSNIQRLLRTDSENVFFYER